MLRFRAGLLAPSIPFESSTAARYLTVLRIVSRLFPFAESVVTSCETSATVIESIGRSPKLGRTRFSATR